METRLGGQGADARVTGAYATHGRQHIDFDTTQEHAAPNTTSDLAFRGVLQGRSSAVWKGNIIVDPGRAEDRRVPGVAQPADLQARPRRRDPRASRSRPTTSAAPTPRRSPRSTPSSSSTCARTACPRTVAKRLVIEGFLSALVERFEEGPVREVLGDALERRLGS